MLIDVTPQEMRSICAALDLLEEYIDEEDRQHIALRQGKRSFTEKVMRYVQEHEKMRAAIMDRAEAL
jgi:hypothetical protein